MERAYVLGLAALCFWGVVLTVFGVSGCARMGYDPDEAGISDAGNVGDGLKFGDSSRPHDALGDVPFFEAGSPWPEFAITGMQGYWATPNAIAWVWQCLGDIPDFSTVSLCTADSPDVLSAGQGNCLEAQDAFSLGQLECKGDPWWVIATTYGLQPQSTYYAQVRFKDTLGNIARSEVASFDTEQELAAREIIFADALPTGASLVGLSLSDSNPAAGDQGLIAQQTSGSSSTLSISGLSLSFPGLDSERFSSGYVEFFIDMPNLAGVAVYLETPSNSFEFKPPNGFASPDSKPGYQRIQVPLTQFFIVEANQRLTVEDLKTMTTFSLHAIWGVGEVLVDEVAIVY